MKSNPFAVGLVAALVAGVAGCGSSIKCGDGTFKKGDKCVGYDPDDETPPVTTVDPPGGRSRDPIPAQATLTTDEPATIYYTLDGSEPGPDGPSEPSPVVVPDITEGTTVRFYAVDVAGNQETPRSVLFSQDIRGPAKLEVAVAVSDSAATFTWTNPTDPDFVGVLLARAVEPYDFLRPEPGTFYTAGATLGTGLEIVVAGAEATSFTETGLMPGENARMLAWTYDDLGNYTGPVPVSGRTGVGLRDGAITVAVLGTAGTTTMVTQQPEFLTFSADATYDVPTGTLTVSLTVDNPTFRAFHNPKAIVTNVSVGTFSASGMLDGQPYAYLGPESIVPAGSLTKDLTFTGVGLTDTVAFDVSIADHPSLYTGTRTRRQDATSFRAVDTGTGVFQATLPIDPAVTANSPNRGFGQHGTYRTAAFSTAADRMFLGASYSGTLQMLDLATNTVVGGVLLAGNGSEDCRFGQPCGGVPEVASNGFHIFAVAKTGHYGRSGSGAIVRLDDDLVETGRFDLPSVGNTRRELCIGPAGILAYPLPTNSEILLLDTWTMEEIDGNPSFPGVNRLMLPSSDIRTLAFSHDGGMLYAASRSDSLIYAVDLATFEVREIQLEGSTSIYDLHVDGAGRVWIGRASTTVLYDPSDGSVSTTAYPNPAGVFHEVAGELYAVRHGNPTIHRLDQSGGVVDTWNTDASLRGHWAASSPE